MLHALSFASVVLFNVGANAMNIPFSPVPPQILESQGMTAPSPHLIAATGAGGPFATTNWIYTADSSQADRPASAAQDGNTDTYWHSMYSPTLVQLPHTMTIDMLVTKNVDGLRYVPRQDGNNHGNIGQHKVYLSVDCKNFGNPVAYGTWYDDQTSKDAAFELQPARCVRIVAVTEAGNRGPWTSASEFIVYGQSTYTKPNPALGLWGPTINVPLVPAVIAVEPNTGNILSWSSYAYDSFGAATGQTQTSLWNPTTQIVTQRLVTNTQHDMFCPGTSMDTTGRVIITGGDTSQKTSIYDGGPDSVSSYLNEHGKIPANDNFLVDSRSRYEHPSWLPITGHFRRRTYFRYRRILERGSRRQERRNL
jgi:galactose oxidase